MDWLGENEARTGPIPVYLQPSISAKAIGVSNFHLDRLVDLITHTGITPAVNQIETRPFFQRSEDQRIMKEHGVQITEAFAMRTASQPV